MIGRLLRGAAVWAAVALGLALAAPARAEAPPLAGEAAPGFQAALALWLDGEEAAALPELAALARAENRAAQVLLGLIDVTPQYQGRWLYARPRAERIALMRAPAEGSGGLSGRNWLRLAAVDTPLAAAWVQLWEGDAGAEAMLSFVRLGEAGASRTAAKRLARRDVRGFGALADDPDFPAFAMGLAIRDWQGSAPERAALTLAALDPADPGRALVGAYRPDPAALLALAATDPGLALLAGHLEALCPGPEADTAARAARLAAAFEGVGGWWGLADLGPPVERLVGAEAWVASAQGQAAFVRLLPRPEAVTGAVMGAVMGGDACLADLARRGAIERGETP